MRYTATIMPYPDQLFSRTRTRRAVYALCWVVLLGGCATSSVEVGQNNGDQPEAGGTEEPELTLNLPEQGEVECTDKPDRDLTFLERGLGALAAGDHIEAVQHFQRYARLESSAIANWESGIAIAYDSMLPQSPFYDARAASLSYAELQAQDVATEQAHPQVLVMREALATFSALHAEIGELKVDNAELQENLAKREEALKRLRELTLGQ